MPSDKGNANISYYIVNSLKFQHKLNNCSSLAKKLEKKANKSSVEFLDFLRTHGKGYGNSCELRGQYIASVGGLVWENSLLYCTRLIMINVRTNDRHMTAVCHIGDAVHEFQLKLGYKVTCLQNGVPNNQRCWRFTVIIIQQHPHEHQTQQ